MDVQELMARQCAERRLAAEAAKKRLTKDEPTEKPSESQVHDDMKVLFKEFVDMAGDQQLLLSPEKKLDDIKKGDYLVSVVKDKVTLFSTYNQNPSIQSYSFKTKTFRKIGQVQPLSEMKPFMKRFVSIFTAMEKAEVTGFNVERDCKCL